VALQLDAQYPEAARERGQQTREAALDRPERPVKQPKRRARAVTLVVQLERADVDVARGLRPPHAWLR